MSSNDNKVIPPRISVAIDIDDCKTVQEFLSRVIQIGYSYLVVSLLPSDSIRATNESTGATITRDELSTAASDYYAYLVGKVITPAGLASSDVAVRLQSEQMLRTQLDIALHLSLYAVMVPLPLERGSSLAALANLARLFTTQLQNPTNHQPIWVRVPMRAPEAVSFWTRPSTSPAASHNSNSTSSTPVVASSASPSWSSVVLGAKRAKSELAPTLTLANGFDSGWTDADGQSGSAGSGAGASAGQLQSQSVSTAGGSVSGAGEMEADVEEGELVGAEAEAEDGEEFDAAWRAWSTFHALTGFQRDVGLALELTPDLPSDELLQRWLAEPIRALLVPVSLFLTNASGANSTLSFRHQAFLYSALRVGASVVFTDLPADSLRAPQPSRTVVYLRKGSGSGSEQEEPSEPGFDVEFDACLKHYLKYIKWVNMRRPESSNSMERLLVEYNDYLQTPLQPLSDNLASNTYSTFEKDPVKYELYEEAIGYALVDRIAQIKAKCPSYNNADSPLVIMVVGAGRGPIVRSALNAAKRTNANVHIYALDKNPHAVNTLEKAKRTEWTHAPVRVVCADMRFWEPPDGDRADLLVSELLGSFSDNELSPECLDGAQRLLKEEGICIPRSYTSYIAPIQSSRLYSNVREGPDIWRPSYEQRYTWAFETGYVVKLQNHILLEDPKPVFTFSHPNSNVPCTKPVVSSAGEHNSRFEVVSWPITREGVLHGFSGFFECVLYGNVIMSIHPNRPTPRMVSWFPMMFPLRSPVRVQPPPAGVAASDARARISLAMWRVCSEQRVWYEWALLEPQQTEIHNPAGRSYSMSKLT